MGLQLARSLFKGQRAYVFNLGKSETSFQAEGRLGFRNSSMLRRSSAWQLQHCRCIRNSSILSRSVAALDFASSQCVQGFSYSSGEGHRAWKERLQGVLRASGSGAQGGINNGADSAWQGVFFLNRIWNRMTNSIK